MMSAPPRMTSRRGMTRPSTRTTTSGTGAYFAMIRANVGPCRILASPAHNSTAPSNGRVKSEDAASVSEGIPVISLHRRSPRSIPCYDNTPTAPARERPGSAFPLVTSGLEDGNKAGIGRSNPCRPAHAAKATQFRAPTSSRSRSMRCLTVCGLRWSCSPISPSDSPWDTSVRSAAVFAVNKRNVGTPRPLGRARSQLPSPSSRSPASRTCSTVSLRATARRLCSTSLAGVSRSSNPVTPAARSACSCQGEVASSNLVFRSRSAQWERFSR
jgi:hypothetical protein